MVEPVERLGRGDDVGGRVRQRDRLGAPRDRVHVGESGLELGAHLVERLDRGHALAERDERARELPCAGAEIDDVTRLVADQPAHGLFRITGPSRARTHLRHRQTPCTARAPSDRD